VELIQRADLSSSLALAERICRVRLLLGERYIVSHEGGLGYSFTERRSKNKGPVTAVTAGRA
jgi:hypothetical protein